MVVWVVANVVGADDGCKDADLTSLLPTGCDLIIAIANKIKVTFLSVKLFFYEPNNMMVKVLSFRSVSIH